MEVLLQLVLEYLMGPPGLCPRLFRTDNGMQPRLGVHIFMNGRLAVAAALALQTGRHAAAAVHSAVAAADFGNLLHEFSAF